MQTQQVRGASGERFKNHKRELSMRGMMIAADNDSDFPTGHNESLHQ